MNILLACLRSQKMCAAANVVGLFHTPLLLSSFFFDRAYASTAHSRRPRATTPLLVWCPCWEQDPLCTPALRTLGNMVSGNEAWADAVMVHKEFLPCLDSVLKNQVDYIFRLPRCNLSARLQALDTPTARAKHRRGARRSGVCVEIEAV